MGTDLFRSFSQHLSGELQMEYLVPENILVSARSLEAYSRIIIIVYIQEEGKLGKRRGKGERERGRERESTPLKSRFPKLSYHTGSPSLSSPKNPPGKHFKSTYNNYIQETEEREALEQFINIPHSLTVYIHTSGGVHCNTVSTLYSFLNLICFGRER